MALLRTFALLLFVALPFARAMAADGASTFAARLPAKTCLAVYSSDVAETCAAFQKTRLGETLCGPDFKPLIAELARLELAGPLQLRPAFGFDWSDLAKVREPGGLAMFPLADGKLGVAWIFLTPPSATGTPACLTSARNYFKSKGFRETSLDRSGAKLSVWQPPATRAKETPRVGWVAKDCYGVATSQAAAEAILSVKADGSLATAGAFQKLQPALAEGKETGASDLRFFIEPVELTDLVERSEPPKEAAKETASKPAPEASGKATGGKKDKADAKTKKASKDKKTKKPAATDRSGADMARRMGLDGVQALAGRVSFTAAAPCEWQVQASLLAPGPYRGALRMLTFESGPLEALPTWIPVDCVSLSTWRWNFSKSLKGFGTLFDEANQPGPDGEGLFEDMLDGLRDDAEGVQVDLRRDVFERLGSKVLRVTLPEIPADKAAEKADDKPNKKHANSERPWVFVAEVRDVKTVRDALTRFYKGDKRVDHKTTGKYDVWTVGKGASLFVEGEADSVVTVRALALGEGQMIFGTDEELLNRAIAPGGKDAGFAKDPSWAGLLGWIKSQQDERAALRALWRLDEFMHTSYQAATKPPEVTKDKKAEESENTEGALWRLLLFGTTKAAAELPYAAAPKFDRLRPALPPSALFLSPTADGWNLRMGVLGPGPKTP